MNLITRQRRFMKHVDEYVNKINVINAELRTQMTWAQIKQKKFVNVYRIYDFKYVVKNKVWLNIRNMKIKRSSKKFENKNDELFIIKVVYKFHVYELKLFTDWIIHFVFHISLLRLNSNDSLSDQISFESLFNYINSENNEYWKIKNILVIEIRVNRLKVLVKWIEYEKFQWKSMKDIVEDAEDLIKKFYENHFTTAEVDF